MTATLACAICGLESHDVKPSLIEWKAPLDGVRFDFVPRCSDRAACRARCEAMGEPWPVPEPRKSDAA
jgi:hypothetical protein